MNSDPNQLQQDPIGTPAEMPSGTRAALPKPKGRERVNSLQHFVKADISVEDQLKYRRHLLLANQNFVGFNKENLDIIAISFEHLCFSEATNKREYKAKIRAKLREWNYEEFSEEDEADGGTLSMDQSPEISGETLNPSLSPSGFTPMRTPSEAPSRNPTPHSSGSTASKGSSKLGVRSSSSRARLPSPPQQASSGVSMASTLFDPAALDKINLNDPAARAIWVEAVWRYFTSGGRPPSDISNAGRVRSSSFAATPSSVPPITPTMSHFQPLAVPSNQQVVGEYEVMEGLETHYQEGYQHHGIDYSGQMVDMGALSPGSFLQEQWPNIQDQDLGNT